METVDVFDYVQTIFWYHHMEKVSSSIQVHKFCRSDSPGRNVPDAWEAVRFAFNHSNRCL